MIFEFSKELKNQINEVCSDYPKLISLVEQNDMNALSYLQGSYLTTIPFTLFKSCKENGDFSEINMLITKSEKKSKIEKRMLEEINIWQSNKTQFINTYLPPLPTPPPDRILIEGQAPVNPRQNG